MRHHPGLAASPPVRDILLLGDETSHIRFLVATVVNRSSPAGHEGIAKRLALPSSIQAPPTRCRAYHEGPRNSRDNS